MTNKELQLKTQAALTQTKQSWLTSKDWKIHVQLKCRGVSVAHSPQHVTLTELRAINPYYSRLFITKISDEGAGLEEPCVASIKQNKQLLTNFPPNKNQTTNKQKKNPSPVTLRLEINLWL